MVSQYAASLLRGDLDRVPLWRGNHVAVAQVLEDYARYPYLQRVREPDVLIAAMRDGIGLITWATDAFAYAESWDEAKQRYVGLRPGGVVNLTSDASGLLVKPAVAVPLLDVEHSKPAKLACVEGSVRSGTGAESELTSPLAAPTKAPEPEIRRFHGAVHLDPNRVGRDAGKIAEEIVQHLALLPEADVHVVLEIQANLPQGAPENVVRTVTENCRTLKFQSQGFEKE